MVHIKNLAGDIIDIGIDIYDINILESFLHNLYYRDIPLWRIKCFHINDDLFGVFILDEQHVRIDFDKEMYEMNHRDLLYSKYDIKISSTSDFEPLTTIIIQSFLFEPNFNQYIDMNQITIISNREFVFNNNYIIHNNIQNIWRF